MFNDIINSNNNTKLDEKPAVKLINILIEQSQSSILSISNQANVPLTFGFNIYQLIINQAENKIIVFNLMLDLLKQYQYPLDKLQIIWNQIKHPQSIEYNQDLIQILSNLMEKFIDKKELKLTMEILKWINDQNDAEILDKMNNNLLFENILTQCIEENEIEFSKFIYNEYLINKYSDKSYLKCICLCLEMYVNDKNIEMSKRIWNDIIKNNESNKTEILHSTWNKMIKLYAKNGDYQELMDHYGEMKENEIECNGDSFIELINVCYNIVNLEKGKSIHLDMVRTQNKLKFGENSKLLQDIEIQKSLLKMYSKCNDFINTLKHWNDLKNNHNEELNINDWNCIINVHSVNGNVDDILSLYHELKNNENNNIKPNDITYTMIIDVLNRKGMKEKANEILNESQSGNDNILEINSLSRSGNFEEAEKIINDYKNNNNNNMNNKKLSENIKSSNIMWMTLLSACRRYNDIERAKRIYQHIVEINGGDESAEYCQSAKLLLANIYGSIKEPVKEKQLRLEISKHSNRGFKKTPGMSFVEIDGKQHKFFAHYKGHERNKEIWTEVRRLTEIMKKDYGYVPNQRWVTRQLKSHETVESYLMGHSERLAFGLANISTPPESKIIIGKNLRACGDCHEWFKMASAITNRLILCRDAKRFHHFEHGKCSCNDFW